MFKSLLKNIFGKSTKQPPPMPQQILFAVDDLAACIGLKASKSHNINHSNAAIGKSWRDQSQVIQRLAHVYLPAPHAERMKTLTDAMARIGNYIDDSEDSPCIHIPGSSIAPIIDNQTLLEDLRTAITHNINALKKHETKNIIDMFGDAHNQKRRRDEAHQIETFHTALKYYFKPIERDMSAPNKSANPQYQAAERS